MRPGPGAGRGLLRPFPPHAPAGPYVPVQPLHVFTPVLPPPAIASSPDCAPVASAFQFKGLPWSHLCNAAPSTLPQPHGAGAPMVLCNCLFLCASAPPTLRALEGRARMLVNPVTTASPEEPLGAYTAQACLRQVHGASTAQTG
ncbi:uncharacterized protein [Symphalangus syndactylus]|uniref:uncharacterized protein n=1 Tax=Symphalangus syndactylus TaxID=9590 RepID=UPI003005C37A